MRKNKRLAALLVCACMSVACVSKTQNYPKGVSLIEPDDPQPVTSSEDWKKLKPGVNISWGSSNERYHREYIPGINVTDSHTCTGWRGERVNAQMVIWSKGPVKDLTMEIGDLKSTKRKIEGSCISCFFVRNVITDEFLGGCGYKTKKKETAHLSADCLENINAITMRDKSSRGAWFNIDIPQDAAPGVYKAKIVVKSQGKKIKTMKLELNILDRVLPEVENWGFALDLWQNPFAVARIHNVELWSEEHFKLLLPLYKMLADAGQKCITASIVYKPWGGQTYDPFKSMIKHTLKSDGNWEYDYTVFDKWISFMMQLGIKEQVNCYSLIPWGNQLWYYDEKLDKDTFIVAKASSGEFKQYWVPFLESFKLHLKQKNIYDIVTIAMDERPLNDMLSAVEIIKEHSGLKISSAANYNPGMSKEIYDLSVESRHILPAEVIKNRRNNGQKTTYYVCCSAEYPNNFTFSPPAEGVWQGWYAYASNLDGFLRWAYNSWVEDPLNDTRFRTWPAGDTFFAYPGAKSSIRFEKLREGIQDYEKLSIIIEELKKSDTDEAKESLLKVENMLQEFRVEVLKKEGALSQIVKAKGLLNSL